jgi:flagellar biosynthesis/type III secretory pathway protein FliH
METEEQEGTADPVRPNVRTFKPSSFQASQFEVVTPGAIATEFAPDQFTVVDGAPVIVDPMFDTYDDLMSSGQGLTGVLLQGESTQFELDIEVGDEGAEDGSGVDEDGNSTTVSPGREGQPVEADEAVVPVSEVELLQQRFEEERLALQAEHEKHLEEVKAALQQELAAHYATESDEKVKAIEERYRTIIDDMGGQIRQEVEAVERRAVEFAIQVARKLVGTIVEINPEYILQVIQEAVKLTGGATIKAIRVSPQDLEFLKMLTPERQFKEFDGSWSFLPDETIRAGCIVETSSGEVEFDLDKTWERIRESVTKVR